MTSEIDVVIDAVSSITKAPFKEREIGESRLLLRGQALWFVWCDDFSYIKEVRPLRGAWKSKDGSIWLETAEVADMIALVEREYGEKEARRMSDIEPGVAPSGKMPDEIAGYPRIVHLLKKCQREVVEMSKKAGIQMKVLYDGGTGVTTLRIGARIDSPSDDEETLRQQIIATARVLKEAYDAVLEARMPEGK